MSCNSCAKGFSLIRQEKGCPGCGFSFCSKCLRNKVFLPKLNSEAKVCAKCERSPVQKMDDENKIIAPDAYYKRLAATEDKTADNASVSSSSMAPQSIDDQILARLQKLKEDTAKTTNEEEIRRRLQGIKEVQATSDNDIQYRLAQLKGSPVIVCKPFVLPPKDLRTEQEQADDLLKQYVEQTQIDTKYKDEFDSRIGEIESRMQRLKGTNIPSAAGAGTSETTGSAAPSQIVESEDEEESVRKIVKKLKAEALIEGEEIAPSTHDELPFCEICNEDATVRCLGCRYLFCKRCFHDHKDDDDGCNRYEPYQPKKKQY